MGEARSWRPSRHQALQIAGLQTAKEDKSDSCDSFCNLRFEASWIESNTWQGTPARSGKLRPDSAAFAKLVLGSVVRRGNQGPRAGVLVRGFAREGTGGDPPSPGASRDPDPPAGKCGPGPPQLPYLPFFARSSIHEPAPSRIHAHRASCRHLDHRGLDRLAAAGGPVGPRGRPADPVHQQHQAGGAGDPQLSFQRERRPGTVHVPRGTGVDQPGVGPRLDGGDPAATGAVGPALGLQFLDLGGRRRARPWAWRTPRRRPRSSPHSSARRKTTGSARAPRPPRITWGTTAAPGRSWGTPGRSRRWRT